MKYLFLLALLVRSVLGVAQADYVIPEVVLKEPVLQEAVRKYLEEYRDDLLTIGAIVLKKNPVDSCYYVSYTVYQGAVEEWPPSFYSLIEGKLVLLYSGFESDLKFGRNSCKMLFKIAGKRLARDPLSITYDPVIWKITVKNTTYVKHEVDRIPLPY